MHAALAAGAGLVPAAGRLAPQGVRPRAATPLALQRTAGNRAVAAMLGSRNGPDRPVQRAPGGKAEMDAPRFKGENDLECCKADTARLTKGGRGKAGVRKVEGGSAVKKVQDALVELAYLDGAMATGDYNDSTWDAVKELKRKEGLGWEHLGDVGPGTMGWLDKKFAATKPACPPCESEERRGPECAPCTAPAQTKVCGPNIDPQLTKVLTDMQVHFRGLTPWQKHWSCQWLVTPPMATMAWDIHQLFLPKTGWLRRAPWQPPCGIPAAPRSDVEDKTTCGNSVQVGGRCNLAGTANYSTWGILTKECHSFYSSRPSYPSPSGPWGVNAFLFTEGGMQSFITAYKLGGLRDDPGPPKEFAVATYRGGPTGRPSTENRPDCATTCSAPATPPTFTFVWEPYQAR